MIRKKNTLLGSVLFAGCFVLSSAFFVPSSFALDKFISDLDMRTKSAQKASGSMVTKTVKDFLGLAKKKRVYIDVQVILDGKTRYQVMTRSEGDTRRYNVGCRFGSWGQLPMGFGIEYFIKTSGAGKEEVNLVVYPGSRSEQPDNDISCVYDKRFPKDAILRVRGLYKVTANHYPNRTDVQLRPISRSDLSPADRKKLP